MKVHYDVDINHLEFKKKIRPIVEVAHTDALIFSLYAAKLNKNYEQRVATMGIDQVATAYRRGLGSNIESSKSVIDQVFGYKNCWIIKSDFVGFFDHLNHKMLKQRVIDLVGVNNQLTADWYAVMKALTKYRHIRAEDIPADMVAYAKKKRRYLDSISEFDEAIQHKVLVPSPLHQVGIPQGTSMSAALANTYMLPFDYAMNTLAAAYDGMYRRYSDDFVLVIPKKISAKSIVKISKDIKVMAARLARLELESKKTKILLYSKVGQSIQKLDSKQFTLTPSVFDYLGFVFDGQRVMLRSKAIFKFSHKSRHSVRQTAFAEDAILNGELSLYIPYQTAYHRLAGQYLNMKEKAQTFRGYAATATHVYQKDNPGYEVIIDKQARKIVNKCQLYLHQQRKKYEDKQDKSK